MRNNSEYRKRIYNVTLMIPVVTTALLFIYRKNLIEYFSITPFKLDLLTILSTLLSVAILLMGYLQTGFIQLKRNSNESDNLNNNLGKIEKEFINIRQKIENLEKQSNIKSIELSKKKQNELEDLIKSKIINETTENIIKNMEEKVENNLSSRYVTSFIQSSFNEIIIRLKKEITTLNRRSNLNLVLGILITVVGIYLLYTFVYSGEIKHNNTLSFLMHFAPRISLVVFIEVFAFFFLSLYKSSLSEIKYYQNEMTIIETKYIALVTAYELNSEEITTEILREFSKNPGSFFDNEGKGKNDGPADISVQQIKADNIVEVLSKLIDVYKKN